MRKQTKKVEMKLQQMCARHPVASSSPCLCGVLDYCLYRYVTQGTGCYLLTSKRAIP